jgi:transcriptional regulator NrdR family protein
MEQSTSGETHMAKSKNTKTKGKTKNFTSRLVVKRRGHTEKFDERKIYASVYEACHVDGMKTEKAEKIAASVTQAIKKKIEKLDKVSSHAIHAEVVKELKKHHADVAYLYEHHKEIC